MGVCVFFNSIFMRFRILEQYHFVAVHKLRRGMHTLFVCLFCFVSLLCMHRALVSFLLILISSSVAVCSCSLIPFSVIKCNRHLQFFSFIILNWCWYFHCCYCSNTTAHKMKAEMKSNYVIRCVTPSGICVYVFAAENFHRRRNHCRTRCHSDWGFLLACVAHPIGCLCVSHRNQPQCQPKMSALKL